MKTVKCVIALIKKVFVSSYCGNPYFHGFDIISAFSNVISGLCTIWFRDKMHTQKSVLYMFLESFSPVMYQVYWNEILTKNLHDSYVFHAEMIYFANFCILN